LQDALSYLNENEPFTLDNFNDEVQARAAKAIKDKLTEHATGENCSAEIDFENE